MKMVIQNGVITNSCKTTNFTKSYLEIKKQLKITKKVVNIEYKYLMK
jgi:hypothetical protein